MTDPAAGRRFRSAASGSGRSLEPGCGEPRTMIGRVRANRSKVLPRKHPGHRNYCSNEDNFFINDYELFLIIFLKAI